MRLRLTSHSGRFESRACVTLLVTLSFANCSQSPGNDAEPESSAAVQTAASASSAAPLTAAPPGFATAQLALATPAPAASAAVAAPPAGSVWYLLRAAAAPTDASGGEFEWYVRAKNLLPNRVYRIELSVDYHEIYSIGYGRSDASGVLTVHGVLHQFSDRYCVSTPAVPRPFTGWQAITFAVKSDGSGSGSASPVAGSPLSGRSGESICDGNHDDNFEYWLFEPEAITPRNAGIAR